VQDVRSNIEGVEAQFQAAQSESGVIGVGKQKSGGGRTADVDVEAGNGSRWVEVKNTEPFGLESIQSKRGRRQGRDAPRCEAPKRTAPRATSTGSAGSDAQYNRKL